MSVHGKAFIMVDSGASRCLFRRRGLFKSYKVSVDVFVYTASGEAIPAVGRGTVEGIPTCLHVPTLDKGFLSVPHIDVRMEWRTTFENGVCLVHDRRSGTVKITGEPDRDIKG